MQGQGAGVCPGVNWVTVRDFLFWTAGRVEEPCASAPRLGGSTSGSVRGRQCPPEGSRLRTGLPRASLGDPGSHQSCLNAYAGAREGPTPAPAWDSHGPCLAAIRVTCTGSCRVSNKANDSAWVVEESYFNSALSLADKGESGTHPSPPPTEMGLSVPLLSHLPLASPWLACPLPGFLSVAGTGHCLLGAWGWRGQFLPGLDGCSGSLSAAGPASALGPVMAPCPLSPPLSCPQGACLLESTASPSSSW